MKKSKKKKFTLGTLGAYGVLLSFTAMLFTTAACEQDLISMGTYMWVAAIELAVMFGFICLSNAYD